MLRSRPFVFLAAAATFGLVWLAGTGGADDKKAGNVSATSPDGKIVATGDGKAIRFFDKATGKEIRRILGHQGRVTAIAFSPDGRRFVSGGEDKTVRMWDIATGKILWQLQAHQAGVSSVVFSPDGKNVITTDANKKSITSDAATGKIIKQ
jgi:WD40 repeat protein